MANNINWGKIYESTAWGSGVTDNNISWGKSYADLAGGGGFTGLLDTYSGAAAAYSLRQLSSTYSGNAIKVRRASDNAEQDIAFANNELDTATLETFASGTDAFVTTWYDQSGNGYDVVNATAAEQPKIVSSGSTILENGKAVIEFANDANFLQNTTFSGGSVYSLFAANKFIDNFYMYALSVASTNNSFRNNGSTSFLRGTSDISYAQTIPTSQILFSFFQDSTSEIYNNGTLKVSGGNGSDNMQYITLSSRDQSISGGNKMQEFILYDSNQSANRTGIETNINDYYSIY